jgi:hypothetical protein
MFSDYDLREDMASRREAISKEIESLKPDYFLNANSEDLSRYFEDKYRYQSPVLKMEETCFDQEEVDIDVSQDFNRGILDRGRPFYVKGTSITFIVPFEGDANLFRGRPSAFTSLLPYGEVHSTELRFEYKDANHDGQRIRSAFDQSIREVQQYLGFVVEDVTKFNRVLSQVVQSEIVSRREKLLKDRGLAESLGFPMKKREGVPQSFSVPMEQFKVGDTVVLKSGGPIMTVIVLGVGSTG